MATWYFQATSPKTRRAELHRGREGDCVIRLNGQIGQWIKEEFWNIIPKKIKDRQ